MMKRIFLFSAFALVMSCQNRQPEVETTTANVDSTNIAMCQIFCLDGDRLGNLQRIENATFEASEMGADIVCFPETAILGWVNSDAHQRAYPIPGPDSDSLCSIAKRYGVFMCVGLAEKEGDNLYDAVLLIDDRGKILFKHRKVNILTELMEPPYTPGNGVQVVETRFGTIGIMICADSFLDELRSEMKALEPDLVLIPYGWAAEEQEWPEHGQSLEKVVTEVAAIWNCPVIGTDLVGEISHGPWTGQTYGGQSVASDRKGNVIAKGRDRDRDIQLVTYK
jgi:predicted amidohydrolase